MQDVLDERSDYMALMREKSLRELNVKATRAGHYPTLSLDAAYGYSNSDDNLDNETNNVLETYYSSYVENIKIYETYKSCNSLEQVSKAYKALSIANELANDFNNYVEAHKNELNPEVLKEYPLEEIS